MRYITEEEYYERLEALRDKYYSVGMTEWQRYTLALAQYDQSLYADRRAHSEQWIRDQKHYGNLSSDEEIAAYERVKKYTQEYYDDGIISYEKYITEIKDLNKDIYDTRKELLEEALTKEIALEMEALDVRKEILSEEEQNIKDSYDSRVQAIEDYYDEIDLKERQEERASELPTYEGRGKVQERSDPRGQGQT